MVIVYKNLVFKKECGTLRYGYFINDWLKYNIDNYVLKAIAKKHDAIILVTGIEGSGKTTLACTCAHYCDPNNFNLDGVIFDPIELMRRIDTAHPGASLVFDEAILGLSSQDFSTQIQKVLIKKFVTIRKKRLIIFLVLPSIFLLRKYFAVFRTRLLLHAYCPDGITRGSFKFYSYYRKRQLFIRGYKEMNMNATRCDFVGNFANTMGFFFDIDEYENKKEIAIKKINQGKDPMFIERQKFLLKAKDMRETYNKSLDLWRKKFVDLKKEYTDKVKSTRKDTSIEVQKIKTALNTKFTEKLNEVKGQVQERFRNRLLDYKKILVYFYEREKKIYNIETTKDLSLEKFHQQLWDLNLYNEDFDAFRADFNAGKREIKHLSEVSKETIKQ